MAAIEYAPPFDWEQWVPEVENFKDNTSTVLQELQEKWAEYINSTASTAEQIGTLSVNIANNISKGIGDAFAKAIVYGESLSKSFKNLMKSVAAQIISSLIQIGAQRLIQWMAAQLLNLKEASSRLSVLAAQTYAGAFAATAAIPIIGPALAPGVAAGAVATMLGGAAAAGSAGSAMGVAVAGFAKGGVVDEPTIFPMANGVGLMGEAGTEAIMPLARTPEGDLGVKIADSDRGTTVNEFHITLELDGTELGTWIYDGTRSGNIQIHEKAITNR